MGTGYIAINLYQIKAAWSWGTGANGLFIVHRLNKH